MSSSQSVCVCLGEVERETRVEREREGVMVKGIGSDIVKFKSCQVIVQ